MGQENSHIVFIPKEPQKQPNTSVKLILGLMHGNLELSSLATFKRGKRSFTSKRDEIDSQNANNSNANHGTDA